MTPSPQQQAILETQGQAPLIVDAKAGTGKTSTGVLCVNAWASQFPAICAVAFNKKNAEDLKARMPEKVTSATFNSLGHRALYKVLGKSKFRIDSRKDIELARGLDAKNSYPLSRAVSYAKALGIAPLVSSRPAYGLMQNTSEMWSNIGEAYDLEFDPAAANELLQLSFAAALTGHISFDDQLWLSVILHAPFEKANLLVVDEIQDLNPLQREMSRRILARDGTLLGLGDRRQAIYLWRGASADSVDQMLQRFSASELPLNVSYRCPKAVVAEAGRYVSDFYAHETAPDGEVRYWDTWKLQDLLPLAGPNTAILCRNNAPLFALGMKLLRSHIPFTFAGQDFGKGLISLVERLAKTSMPIAQFLKRLDAWKSDQIAAKPEREAKLSEQAETLLFLSSEVGSTSELISTLKALLQDRNAAIVLSSIHKAKGLEWQNVIFLDSWRIPSKYAKTTEELEQESNLAYVATTRAKFRLIFANLNQLEK
jgi:DNA helicase-2/ATP-dependent DNA helicase PcrA